MENFSASVTINRPIEEVFAFLNDQHNHATLNEHNFRDFKVISVQSAGVGAQAEFVLKTGVFHEQVQIEITGSEPPHWLIEEGQLKEGRFRVTWRLSPLSPSQTKLELTTEYKANALAALFEKRIQQAFVRIYGRLLNDLAQKLN